MLRPTVINLSGGKETCDVYIGRAFGGKPESPWANPHKITRDADRPDAIERYRQDVLANPELLLRLADLQGERLGCWCHPKPCHGHVLAAFVEALHRDPVAQLRFMLESQLPAEKTLEFLNRTGWFRNVAMTWDEVQPAEAIRFILRDVRPKHAAPVLEQPALF